MDRRRRIRIERAQRLVVELACYLQAIADLKTPDSGGRVGVFLAGDLTEIKTLFLQRFLRLLDRAIGESDLRQRRQKHRRNES